MDVDCVAGSTTAVFGGVATVLAITQFVVSLLALTNNMAPDAYLDVMKQTFTAGIVFGTFGTLIGGCGGCIPRGNDTQVAMGIMAVLAVLTIIYSSVMLSTADGLPLTGSGVQGYAIASSVFSGLLALPVMACIVGGTGYLVHKTFSN